LEKIGFADDSVLSLLLFRCQPFLQFCERGSLERAMKLGRFRNKTDGQPDVVSGLATLTTTINGCGAAAAPSPAAHAVVL
jgi:hypothetical protein